MKKAKEEISRPAVVIVLQILLAAVIGMLVRQFFIYNFWLSSLLFILVFAVVYALVGAIYLNLNRRKSK